MKYYQTRSALFVTLLLLASTAAQAGGWHKAVKCADKKAQKKYYAAAADKYEHILVHKPCSKDSTWRDSTNAVKLRLAGCYMKMGNSIKAEANYRDVVQSSNKIDGNVLFDYARSLQANGKYAEAKEAFDKITDPAVVKFKKTKEFSAMCDGYMRKRGAGGSGVQVKRMSFNSRASDYAPAFYRGNLVYTSNRLQYGMNPDRIMWNKEAFSDLYSTNEDNKGAQVLTERLPKPINSKWNDAAATFNAAGDEIFFTRNNKKCKMHDQLQILHSKLNGSEWSKPDVLFFESAGFSYAHPALSADGNTLYFSSNMTGTYGGMDIFMTRRSGSTWETPINLGSAINSSGNEIFPYVDADGKLYYASDGLPGFGSLDLFTAKPEGGKFTTPAENMGWDFNSPKDDLSLIYDSKNNHGFLATNRDGDDDIFSFTVKKVNNEPASNKSITATTKTAKIVDKATGAPIAGARVEISKVDNPNGGVFYYTNDRGEFTYTDDIQPTDAVRIVKDGYNPQSYRGVDMTGKDAVTLGMDMVKKEPVEVASVTLYYDVNKSALTAESLEKLKPIVEGAKSGAITTVNVSGFADERGSDTYNYGLSMNRVKGVIDYLTSQEISQTSIHSAFFGAVKLTSECRKTKKCVTETNRQNRRVEVKVLK